MELRTRLTRSMAWNTLEAVFYQGLLLAHQLLLFQCVGRSEYGLIGALFSFTYLVVTLINFGFDISLAPFFKTATKNKHNFKAIFFVQLIPEYFLIATIFIIAMIFKPYFPHDWAARYQLTNALIIGLMLLALFESTKKTFRAILHHAFLNHKTAFVEIATIVCYTAMVWGCYCMGSPLSLPVIFVPMIITSGFCCLALGWHTAQLYRRLPDPLSHGTDERLPMAFQLRILKNRFFNFLNQASHMIFSSNFLVPFFALQFGLQQASILKLVSTIVYCITIILQKVFGISSASMLSHIKESSLDNKRATFAIISNRLNQTLMAIAIFFILNFNTVISWSAAISNRQTWHLLYLFFIISFSENLFIAYEKFYITEEKADYLFIFNLIVMCLMGSMLYHAHSVAPLALLIAIIAIRILAFLGLSALSFYHWQLRPSYTVNPWLAAGSVAFSSLFFILT